MKMDELKNRKTTRLKGADYNRNQAVFLTICTKERRCILSRIAGTGVLDGPQDREKMPVGTGVMSQATDGPQIELSEYGRIADKYIHQLSDFYDDLSVESYVIMPNHIHIMLWVKGADYNRNQAVFLTICTKERKCILSHIVVRKSN